MHTDQDIINKLQQNRQIALSMLMSKYQNYVYTILKAMLSLHDAEEATQDTFVKIYRNFDQYNGDSKLSTWMYRIAYRTGLDYIKKRKNIVSLDEVSDTFFIEKTVDKLEQDDIKNWIIRVINKLNPEDAALIKLYYLNEYSIQEVADITQLTISNVKVKLFRIRNTLKASVQNNKLSSLIN